MALPLVLCLPAPVGAQGSLDLGLPSPQLLPQPSRCRRCIRGGGLALKPGLQPPLGLRSPGPAHYSSQMSAVPHNSPWAPNKPPSFSSSSIGPPLALHCPPPPPPLGSPEALVSPVDATVTGGNAAESCASSPSPSWARMPEACTREGRNDEGTSGSTSNFDKKTRSGASARIKVGEVPRFVAGASARAVVTGRDARGWELGPGL